MEIGTGTVLSVILITYIIGADARGKDWLCPPNNPICQCHAKKRVPYLADCSDQNLTFIPKFEQKYQKLKFSGNNLSYIHNNTFVNVRGWNLTELFLNRSRIKYIEEDAFEGLHLDFIDFSENKDANVTQLSRSFRNQKLKGIDLSFIPLGNSGVADFFNTTVSETLQFVRIASCNLTFLTRDMFKHLQNLFELDLSHNVIHSVDIAILPPVKRLVLKYMKLSELPKFDKSKLESLNIGYNRISNLSALYDKGHLFGDLKYLYADGNPLNTLPKNIFDKLENLYSLSLCDITSKPSDFQGVHSKTLRYFNFSSNFIDERYANVFFHGMENLTHLVMKDTSLKTWSQQNITILFYPLCSKLKSIRLVRTYFKIIPSAVLRCFRKLDILDLSSNNISSWEDDTFTNVAVAKQILLKDNHIKLINETSFPEKLMNRTHNFDFRGNPFSCTCKAHWFRNWMKGKYYKLRGSRGKFFLCDSPHILKGQKFVTYDPTYEDCIGWNKAVIAGLAICGFSLPFITLTVYGGNLYKKKLLA